MANGRNKSGAQLDREINDIVVARQKREARARAAKSVKPQSSGILSQAAYARRELQEVDQRLREVERAPLADRKEAAAAFLAAMRDDPEIVAERIGWLLNGTYGYGQMQKAKRVLASPRMNRSAALTHMVAAYEWQTPNAWKKLTKGQQAVLEKAVQGAIKSAESAESAE
jgi:hypothetical protein